jgi:hypothetical protein
MRKSLAILTTALLCLATVSVAMAHSGGTDKFGCHHDRKTGVYHCH